MRQPRNKYKNHIMKAKKLILPLLSLLLISCEGEPIDRSRLGKQVNLTAAIEGPRTRVAGDSWEKGDAVGIYMTTTGEQLSSDAFVQNIEYRSDGTNSLEATKETESIYFPYDGSTVDFIGYHPYRSDISDFIYPVALYNQSPQTNLDLMYSDNAIGYNENSPDVTMLFSHCLCKLLLNIEYHRPFDLSNMRVIITNVGREATFDLISGTLSSNSSYGELHLFVNKDGSTAEAILLPETDLSEITIWFIVDDEGRIFKYPLADANVTLDSFEPATKYSFNVILEVDEIASVTVANIENWIEGPSVDATLQLTDESPPEIEGTKNSPFSVSRAQDNIDNKDVWVEGYIVGAFTGTGISSFSSDLDDDIKNTAIAIADISDEEDLDKIFPIQLSTGRIRDQLNLLDNPGNLGLKVKIKGDIESYYSTVGLKNCKDFEFVN